jgi:beta-lactamase superfamily II metal-dependent hydrolase
VKITFKYVGQGDTIIIEWKSKGKVRLGIVDCKSHAGLTPAIEHVRDKERVEFMVLTHPHSDHYSGFPALLRFCEQKGIEIGLFVYTTRLIPQYIKTIVLSQNEKDTLADTFRAVTRLKEKGLLEKRGIGTDVMRPIIIRDDVTFELLSPSEDEHDRFARSLFDEKAQMSKSPNANYVSAVSLIDGGDWHILLTSDAERSSLKRIGLGPLKKDFTTLVLGQSPHHGSEKNHYRAFWKNRNHPEGTPIAISAGPNAYGHPSESVVDDFRNLDYEVRATYREQLDDKSASISAELDMISDTSGADSHDSAMNDLVFQVSVTNGEIECQNLPR